MYIPDLFGAYQKGKEYAIDRNWNDLKQYEAVESARNSNDIQALDILRQRVKLPGEVSMYYDNVDSSHRANRIGAIAQPGMEAMTQARSNHAIDGASVLGYLRPQTKDVMYNIALANLGKQGVVANYQHGQNAYWGQTDANGQPIVTGAGWNTAQRGHQGLQAQDVLLSNAVNAAGQQVSLSNQAYQNNMLAGQLQGATTQAAINNQDLVAQGQNAQLRYGLMQTQEAIAKFGQADEATKAQVIGQLVTAARNGDTGAAHTVREIARIWGYDLTPWTVNGVVAPQATTPTPTPTQQPVKSLVPPPAVQGIPRSNLTRPIINGQVNPAQ